MRVCLVEILGELHFQQAQAVNVQQFRQDMLDAHNRYRAIHGSPPLRRNAAAEQSAQAYAEKLLRTRRFEHGDFNGYGQNLGYQRKFDSPVTLNGYEATSWWYDEIRNYNFADPSKSGYTGHFEQVVWASTREIGVGVASDGQTIYFVAHYYPPGRKGDYAQNIRPPNYAMDPR